MFTGIIENMSEVVEVKQNKNNLDVIFKSDLISELKIDQSISHNGVCLTIADIYDNTYLVNIIKETLDKSNLGLLKKGDQVNIERSMILNARIDGHIVQGHVDQTAVCSNIIEKGGSYEMTFEYEDSENVTVEKGSICINGISLTVFNSKENNFSVAIIPYTWDNTNLKNVKIGDTVNLEFDILGKYIAKILSKS
ncbi:MAG: riboflavin synthase [Flavobacteriales bacterium]|nr:riboflavin synthase [Flavobacteriales bacterium]|tara:strand:+ start:795 stop:1379 length:585 start_codon:yes stop_codon:yes gene_type:complete